METSTAMTTDLVVLIIASLLSGCGGGDDPAKSVAAENLVLADEAIRDTSPPASTTTITPSINTMVDTSPDSVSPITTRSDVAMSADPTKTTACKPSPIDYGGNRKDGTVYYVSADGTGDGSNPASPLAFDQIGSIRFQAGDDLLLRSGDRFKGAVRVYWGGSADDRAIISTYGGDKKATLMGAFPIVGGEPGAVPSGAYTGLVDVISSYVTVSNIRAENSSGAAMLATGQAGKPVTHVIFENNEAINPAGNLIQAKRNTSHIVIRNNDMQGCAQAYREGTWVGPNHPVCSGFVGSSHGLMENNVIEIGYGEAIAGFSGGGNNVIRGNTISSNQFLAIYIDGSSSYLIENNTIVGNPGDHDKKNGYSSGAIGINVEDHQGSEKSSTDIVIRNNLIANVNSCFGFNMQPGPRAVGKKIGFQFVGNTCHAAYQAVVSRIPDDVIENSVIANNIFTDIDLGVDACQIRSSTRVSLMSNLWGEMPTDVNCHGVGDIHGDAALAKKNGWRLTGPQNIPNTGDFTPAPGSIVRGAGTALEQLAQDTSCEQRADPPSIGAVE